jgi:hypothetical protein
MMSDLPKIISDEIRIVGDSVLTVFIILKLTDVISWSWVWVLSPFWIIASIVVIFFIIMWIINFLKRNGETRQD